MIEMTPLLASLVVAAVVLVSGLGIYATVRKVKKSKKEASSDVVGDGYTIIILRGAGPHGGIVRGCKFVDGAYTYNPDSDNPQEITYDGDYVYRDATGGEPFMFYDVEGQSLVKYQGRCSNDMDVTLVHHDETAEDVSVEEAKKYKEGPESEPGTVLRKLPQMWRRWGGARLWSEKNTVDWNNIQGNTPGWLAILNKYGGLLILVLIVLVVVFGIIGAVG